MKRLIYTCAFLIIAMGGISMISDESCDTKTLKKEGISELNPFFYSAAKVNTITYDYKASRKEIEVPLFKGEKYKLVFNKKGLPKDVLIEIYDKDKSHSSREPLFTTKDNPEGIVSYEPKKSKKIYVNYVVPKADGVKEDGCVVFILGYQLTFLKEEKVKEDKTEG